MMAASMLLEKERSWHLRQSPPTLLPSHAILLPHRRRHCRKSTPTIKYVAMTERGTESTFFE